MFRPLAQMAQAASSLTISTSGSVRLLMSAPCITAISAATSSTTRLRTSCSARACPSAISASALFQVFCLGGAYLAASSQVDAIALAPTPHGILGISEPIIPGQPITARLVTSQTAFAMTAGGGMDIKINKHVSFRPIGLDYYLTRFQNLRTQGDNNQNNLRYTTGFNFTFGAQ